MFLWYPVLDLARAPRRTARKKGSGYENGLPNDKKGKALGTRLLQHLSIILRAVSKNNMWASHGLDRFCVRPYSVIGPELQVRKCLAPLSSAEPYEFLVKLRNITWETNYVIVSQNALGMMGRRKLRKALPYG